MDGLIKLDRSHLAPAAEMLAAAFRDDPMYTYLMPDAERRRKALPVIFRGMLGVLMARGDVFATSKRLEGILCVTGLSEPRWGIKSLASAFAALRIPFAVARRVSVRSLWKRASAMRPGVTQYRRVKDRYQAGVYIELVAVAEQHRGQGVMSRLMRPLLAQADEAGKACALDTEAERNLPIYGHYGFHILQAIDAVPEELRFYMLAREPGGASGGMEP